MTVSWKSRSYLFCICLSLCATGVVSQTFVLEPQTSTALQGSDVRFNANVQGPWDYMTWTIEDHLVLTVPFTVSNITSEQYFARFCSNDKSCVEFTIHNVTRNESGSVICTVQGDYGSRTAQLIVQESGSISIIGGNVTAVQDEQVEFQCVTSAWFPTPTISWTLNGEAVNSSLYNTTDIKDGDSFNSTSVLNFQAVSSTTVECQATVSALTNPKSSSVFLVVDPKPPDWTVLIAVVVSFGSAALLVLLILGIIFCCKRKNEKQRNYQDEMSRRVRTLSEISVVSGAGRRRGQVNAGYVQDGQTSVVPNKHANNDFSQTNGFSPSEITDGVNSNQAGNDNKNGLHVSVNQAVFIKHRHVTIV